MIKKHVKIPIYENSLHICITNNFTKDLAEINKHYYNEFTKEDEVLGMSQQRAGSTLIILNVGKHKKIFKKNYELEIIATIAHESFHATNMIFKSIGAKTQRDNDETQAYLLDWIVKEIYKCYSESKK